jgi:uncharacterized repeat protein (TIGR01451 family)
MLLGGGSRLRQWSAGSRSEGSSHFANPVARAQSAAPFTPLALGLEPSPSAALDSSRAKSLLAGLPLMFEPNQGQANLDPADARAKFLARGAGYGLFLGTDGAILTLSVADAQKSASTRSPFQRAAHETVPSHLESVQMKLAGANPNANLAGADQFPGKSSYFIGSDAAKWRHDIPQFARVRYENIYPGINLVFYGNQGQLEYDFQVAPFADPSKAELEFDGAQKVELSGGALVVKTASSSVRLETPRVYQQIAGRDEPVEGRFVLRAANRAGFEIGPYDHSRELVIDPVLTFSTYFGGTGNELNTFIAIDTTGDIYITGSTTSPSLPVGTLSPVIQSAPAAPGAQNIYIAKINPIANPTQLIYVTYLGGSGPDTPVGIKVDAAGDAYVAGTTASGVGTSTVLFPVSPNAYQGSPFAGSTGTEHVFVTEIDPIAQTLKYSSYLSGNNTDSASGMTIDASGDIYVTGVTASTNAGSPGIEFPATTANQPGGAAFQALPAGTAPQFFVTKVNTQAPQVGSIAYSTYFGGANFTAPLVIAGGGIAVDANQNIYFTGTTNFTYQGCSGCAASDFPIKNAYQPCLNLPAPPVIVNPPTCAASTSSDSDGFVAKLSPSPSNSGTGQLQWSTYFGGTVNDGSSGVGLDSAGNVYIVGTTNSPDITSQQTSANFGAYQPCLDEPGVAANACTAGPTATDAFVARLTNPVSSTTITNMALSYFTYLGGSGNDVGNAITVDNSSGAVVVGSTFSTDFPIAPTLNNNIQSTLEGSEDAFIARINTAAISGQSNVGMWATYFGGATDLGGNPGVTEGTGIALDVNQNAYFAGDTTSTGIATNLFTTLAGGSDAIVGQVSSAASLGITGVISLGVGQSYISAGNQATFTYTLTNNGPDLANNIVVTDAIDLAHTGIPVTFVSGSLTGGPPCTGGSTSSLVTCTLPALQSGSTATMTIVLVPTVTSTNPQTCGSATFNGGTVIATSSNNTTPASTSIPANMSDFTLQVTPATQTVQQAGDTARYQVLLTPCPVYGNPISLTVSDQLSASSGTFSTNPITLAGSSPSSPVLSVSTTARPIVTPGAAQHLGMWLAIPGLGIVGLCLGGKRRRGTIATMLLLCALFLVVLPLPSCSHSTVTPPTGGTQAGTFPLTVAATSGSDSKSITVYITVP